MTPVAARRPAGSFAPLTLLVALLSVLSGGCSVFAPSPPSQQGNLCEIFRQQPSWYDYAQAAKNRWGTPIATQMAFIQQESAFRSHVRPARTKLLGVIPWRRPSSAHGYAQIQDPAWADYQEQVGGLLARRTHMKYATDFVGWYNRRSHQQLGISLYNPEHLYLAYHEGPTGYRRGTWHGKSQVQQVARRVSGRADHYRAQLASCEAQFRCRRFYQFGPFCKS